MISWALLKSTSLGRSRNADIGCSSCGIPTPGDVPKARPNLDPFFGSFQGFGSKRLRWQHGLAEVQSRRLEEGRQVLRGAETSKTKGAQLEKVVFDGLRAPNTQVVQG